MHVGALHRHGVIHGRSCVRKSIVIRWFGEMSQFVKTFHVGCCSRCHSSSRAVGLHECDRWQNWFEDQVRSIHRLMCL